MHKEYAGYLIDLDGTMYNGNKIIEEAADFVKNKKGKQAFLIFNK